MRIDRKRFAWLGLAAALAIAGCQSAPTSTQPAGSSVGGASLGETHGRVDASGGNAVLITHGNTSSQQAAGRYAHNQAALGVTQAQLGPALREFLKRLESGNR
jgi:hypothetical protein